jgi:hypothetical protein
MRQGLEINCKLSLGCFRLVFSDLRRKEARAGLTPDRANSVVPCFSCPSWGDWEIFIWSSFFIPFQKARVATVTLLLELQISLRSCSCDGGETLAADGIDCAVII